MKNILYFLFFIPLCLACKKEPIGMPLEQYHFINFVDASGMNLFESGKIDTTELLLLSGDFTLNWDDILAEKNRSASSIYESLFDTHGDTLKSMLSNNALLLEVSLGNLGGFGPRERIFSINGKTHTFTYSLKEGFYQNGRKLEATTRAVEPYYLYVHNIILEKF